jgi:hypothetical protein
MLKLNKSSKVIKQIFSVLVFSMYWLPIMAQYTEPGKGRPAEEKATVVFWTNCSSCLPIKVWVNGSYYGTITVAYSSAPLCGASGCVTVSNLRVSEGHNYSAEAANGSKWEKTGVSNKMSVRGGCNTLLLSSSGSTGSTGSSSSSGGDSSGGGTYSNDPTVQAIHEFGDALAAALVEHQNQKRAEAERLAMEAAEAKARAEAEAAEARARAKAEAEARAQEDAKTLRTILRGAYNSNTYSAQPNHGDLQEDIKTLKSRLR